MATVAFIVDRKWQRWRSPLATMVIVCTIGDQPNVDNMAIYCRKFWLPLSPFSTMAKVARNLMALLTILLIPLYQLKFGVATL